ncbi:MAG: hypothetical protein ACRDD7_08500 [Peptostreptococcaceae bacterium]
MKLKELLEITGLNATIIVKQVKENRRHEIIDTIESIDEWDHIDTVPVEACIKTYGNLEVLNQVIENSTVTILVK